MNRRIASIVLSAVAVSGGCTAHDERGPALKQEVLVKLRDSRFIPEHFEFEAGTTVKFVVTNVDPIDHEFIIGDEDTQRAHEQGTEAHHSTKPGEISIPIGATRETTYTFDEPGTLLIGCHLPTHYDYGMRGDILVTD